MNRFFVSRTAFQADRVVLGREQARQIRSVLRMEPNDRIVVLDNRGYEYEVALEDVRRDHISGRVMDKRPACGEPAVRITLYQSLLTREKFEWVLQKCTEVGVGRFVPVVTRRSLVRNSNSINPNRLERWRRILTEAAEQSCRGRIPELAPVVTFEQVLPDFDAYDRCLIGHAPEKGAELRCALRHENNCPVTVALCVGPEGGFAEEEVQLAQAAGAVAVSLGRRIMRTETAAVVAAALILYELGQMEP